MHFIPKMARKTDNSFSVLLQVSNNKAWISKTLFLTYFKENHSFSLLLSGKNYFTYPEIEKKTNTHECSICVLHLFNFWSNSCL